MKGENRGREGDKVRFKKGEKVRKRKRKRKGGRHKDREERREGGREGGRDIVRGRSEWIFFSFGLIGNKDWKFPNFVQNFKTFSSLLFF